MALTLWCARSDLGAEGYPAEERARLGRLVAGYDAGPEMPLSAMEGAALPVAMARQPLSSFWFGVVEPLPVATAAVAQPGRSLAAALRPR